MLSEIVKAAEEKFGVVLSAVSQHGPAHQNPDYKLVIRRKDSAFPERPYMVITAYMHENGHPSFTAGRYDIAYVELKKAGEL